MGGWLGGGHVGYLVVQWDNHIPKSMDLHHVMIQIQINNSFLFRINNSLSCQDLKPGPPW